MTATTRPAKSLRAFANHLFRDEKSPITVDKYLRDAGAFLAFLNGKRISKTEVIRYKNSLIEKGYAVRSINSMLSAVNSYLVFTGLPGCRVKTMRIQEPVFSSADKELTRSDYEKLLMASRTKPRLYTLLQTLCATGIRVSELKYFTAEAVKRGQISVTCKNKTRNILLPGRLRKLLLHYIQSRNIHSGPVFRTSSGKPMHRANIWAEMKGLCIRAGVAASRVFPHNLRKLFARSFYALKPDIAKLADVLGHSSINTTRIYIKSPGTEHRKLLDRLGLVLQT